MLYSSGLLLLPLVPCSYSKISVDKFGQVWMSATCEIGAVQCRLDNPLMQVSAHGFAMSLELPQSRDFLFLLD